MNFKDLLYTHQTDFSGSTLFYLLWRVLEETVLLLISLRELVDAQKDEILHPKTRFQTYRTESGRIDIKREEI